MLAKAIAAYKIDISKPGADGDWTKLPQYEELQALAGKDGGTSTERDLEMRQRAGGMGEDEVTVELAGTVAEEEKKRKSSARKSEGLTCVTKQADVGGGGS